MTMEVSYFRTVSPNGQIAEDPISSQSLTLSSSPASSGVTDPQAMILLITATENLRYEYSGPASAVTATSHFVGSGGTLWLQARTGYTISARTA